MKLFLVIIMFIIAGIISGAAQAGDKFPPGFIEDNRYVSKDQKMIEALRRQHESRAVMVAAIDGKDPAIEISDSRTSLPAEYLDTRKVDAITKSKGEHYGR